jgi:hypothetical protein
MAFSFKSFNGTEVFTSLYASGFDIGEAEGDSPTRAIGRRSIKEGNIKAILC